MRRTDFGSIMPKVSIVIPAYNAEYTIRETLESIQNQSFRDFQVFVVDDGSTDNTASVVNSFCEVDQRFHPLRAAGQNGAGAARNLGLDHVLTVSEDDSGYLIFLDADDLFDSDFIENMVAIGDRDNSDLVFTNHRYLNTQTGKQHRRINPHEKEIPVNRPFSPDEVSDILFQIDRPMAWTKLFRVRFIRRTGLRFQEIPKYNDLAFSFSALAAANRLSLYNKSPIAYRVANPISLAGSINDNFLYIVDAFDELYYRLIATGAWESAVTTYTKSLVFHMKWTFDQLTNIGAIRLWSDTLRDGLLADLDSNERSSAYCSTLASDPWIEDFLSLTSEEWVDNYINRRLENSNQLAALRNELKARKNLEDRDRELNQVKNKLSALQKERDAWRASITHRVLRRPYRVVHALRELVQRSSF